MREELTQARLDQLKRNPPVSKRLEIRDTKARGLILRITPEWRDADTGGLKPAVFTWSVRTRTKDGKQTRPRLGVYPAMGLKDARAAVHDMMARLQSGADPVEEKRAARAARKADAAEATVSDRLAEWQRARITDPKKPWSERYAEEVAGMVKRDLIPSLGAKKLRSTTRQDWTGVVAKKRAKAPGAASSLYRMSSSFLNYAEAAGWIEAPLLPRKGAAILAPPVAARQRALTDAELVEVWNAADREPPKLRAFVRLAILTAAREAEAAGIRVREVNRDAARWTIPSERSKNREAITLPLSPLALAELAAVWPNDAEPGDYLLGRSLTGAFTGFGRLKARMDASIAAARAAEAARAGVKPEPMPAWRWHDLRRTARTGMTRLGVPRDHAEAALNHISGRTALERTYDRHDYAAEVIAALTLWQGHVAGIVGKGAQVVALAERRSA